MRKGFTLMELMVVIVVIGILGTLGYPKIMEAINRSKAEKLVNDLNLVVNAMQRYYKDMGTFPTNLAFLSKRPTDSDSGYDAISLANGEAEDTELVQYWKGPYLTEIPVDKDFDACLKPSTGRVICYGDNVADNSSYGADTWMLTSGDMGNFVQSAPSQDVDAGVYYNVLSVGGLDMEVAKMVAQARNPNAIPTDGNLLDVAKASSNSIIGVPSSANYPKYKRIIFRFSDPF